MEFCGVFYETGYLRAVYDRIRKLFFVFLMAAVLTVGMMGQGMETINFGRFEYGKQRGSCFTG